MRNVLLAVLLAVSLPAMADINAYLNQGLPLAEAYKQASVDCGGNCDADLFAALKAAGISDENIVQAAADAGVSKETIIASASAAGLNMEAPAVQAIVAALVTTQQPTAAGPAAGLPLLNTDSTPPSGGAGVNPPSISPNSPT